MRRRIGAIKKAENVIGNRTRIKVVKNKVSPPFTEAEFDIMYGQGINWEGDLIAVGLARGVIQKKGAWLQYDGEMIGQGKEASRRALEEDKELAARIYSEITDGKPESIEATTSSLVGACTLHPMLPSNSLAVETLLRTLKETLRWCESQTESSGTIDLSCLAATLEKVASITLMPES